MDAANNKAGNTRSSRARAVSLKSRTVNPGPAIVLVRPERVRLVPVSAPGAVRATVVDAVFLGELLRVDVRLQNGSILQSRSMDCAKFAKPNIGDEIGVQWDAVDCWVLE